MTPARSAVSIVSGRPGVGRWPRSRGRAQSVIMHRRCFSRQSFGPGLKSLSGPGCTRGGGLMLQHHHRREHQRLGRRPGRHTPAATTSSASAAPPYSFANRATLVRQQSPDSGLSALRIGRPTSESECGTRRQGDRSKATGAGRWPSGQKTHHRQDGLLVVEFRIGSHLNRSRGANCGVIASHQVGARVVPALVRTH